MIYIYTPEIVFYEIFNMTVANRTNDREDMLKSKCIKAI